MSEPLGKTLNRFPSFKADIRVVDPRTRLYHVALISLPLVLQSNKAEELTEISWLFGALIITGSSVKKRERDEGVA